MAADQRNQNTGRPMTVVRLASTDLDGSKPVKMAMLKIKGISKRIANSILLSIQIDPNVPVSQLPPEKISAIEKAIENPAGIGLPVWMLNRRNDPETGITSHLIGTKLNFIQMEDINRMKKIKSYKGVRHEAGQPVRGQKTRTSFRGQASVGVSRKGNAQSAKAAAAPAAAPAAKPAGKPAAPAKK